MRAGAADYSDGRPSLTGLQTGGTMLDALKQAERYHELAEGCRRLAAFSFSSQMQDHYFQMAEHYTALAETEEREAVPSA
jgi:hypothetical protein